MIGAIHVHSPNTTKNVGMPSQTMKTNARNAFMTVSYDDNATNNAVANAAAPIPPRTIANASI